MAKKPARKSKSIVKQPKVLDSTTKLRKKPQYKSFRLHKRIKHPAPKIPNWWQLTKKSLALMSANKKPLIWFFVVYGLLTLLLVRGFTSSVDVAGIKDSLQEDYGLSDSDAAVSGLAAFSVLLNSGTQASSEIAQLYQIILLLLASLALIWLFRQQQAGNRVGLKMAIYRGMYPLVPFVFVLFVIAIQLLPAFIGSFLFSTVLSNGLAVNGFEQLLWLLLFVATLLLSLYMLSSSVVAAYVVTLPEMTPMTALKQARGLVRFRRVSVMRKILAIILVFLLVNVIVVLPLIFFAPLAAEWLFFAITILAVPFVHGYLFSLYRELL